MNAPVREVAVDTRVRKRDAHICERHENDYYVEPPWCSRRLFEAEAFGGYVWDPACGGGNIVKSALSCGIEATGSDIADRGFGGVQDFLDPEFKFVGVTNIVSNPPFELADQFVARALQVAQHTVAMLLPAVWHCGDKRSRWLATTPLRKVLILTPRPSMPPGSVIAAGEKAGGGTKDFAWFIWRRGYVGPVELNWLRREAPSRAGVAS